MAAKVRQTRYGRPFQTFFFGALFIVAALVFSAWMAGVTGGMAQAGVHASERALLASGFRVDHIDVRGATRTDAAEISRRLLIEEGELVFRFRPDLARARIEELAWVRSASVLRLLPNRLLVIVEERAPMALWRESAEAELRVLDDRGEPIDGARAAEHAGLLIVEGEGAPEAAAALIAALDEHRDLRARASHFVRVGSRRWNIALAEGGEVYLPERTAAGLARLAALQASERVLEWDIEFLDLRNGDLVVRGRPAPEAERGA